MAAVMIIGFLVNGLLLFGTSRLAAEPVGIRSLLTGALLGAVLTAAGMWTAVPFLAWEAWHLFSLLLISVVTFGVSWEGLKACGLFSLLTMAMGGAAMAVGEGSRWSFPIAAAVVCAMSCLCVVKRQRFLKVEINGEKGTVAVRALKDTGNELRDPVTGERILVIAAAPAKKLTGLTQQQLKNALETMESGCGSGLRLVPFRTVGEENGMLLAKRFNRVTVDGMARSMVVAFAANELGGEAYQALLGGNL